MYYEDGTLGSHKYIDKNGNEVDKTPKKEASKSNISLAELKKPYKCKCCKATINGINDAINTDGFECNQLNLSLVFSAYSSNLFNNMDVNNLIRGEYPYCSLKCFKTCN